jgi:hypothetical protein
VRRRIVILALAVLTLAAGIFLWSFGDSRTRETRRIQRRLESLAQDASFSERDHAFRRLAYSGQLAGYFAETVVFDTPEGQWPQDKTMKRSELEAFAAAVRTRRGLDMKFLDIAVHLEEPPTNAIAHLTSKIYFTGDQDYWVQEFRLGLRVSAPWNNKGLGREVP